MNPTLSSAHIERLLDAVRGETATSALIVLLHGAGLKLSEALRLQLRNVDLAGGVLRVRSARRGSREIALTPDLAALLQRQREVALARWRLDGIRSDAACASMWLFPSPARARDSRTGAPRRNHVSERRFLAALQALLDHCGIAARATPGLLCRPLPVPDAGPVPPKEAGAPAGRIAFRRRSSHDDAVNDDADADDPFNHLPRRPPWTAEQPAAPWQVQPASRHEQPAPS